LHEDHTKKWDHQEQYIPQVADRLSYPEWLASGKRSVLECAKEKHDEILTNHKPIPLTAEQEIEIEAILKEQSEYYSKRNILN
jgi:trimethylamine:corrinoid methyltransferase-like protein